MKHLWKWILAAPTGAALAHSGHGTTDGNGWLHQVAEPEHLLVLLVIGAGVALLVREILRREAPKE